MKRMKMALLALTLFVLASCRATTGTSGKEADGVDVDRAFKHLAGFLSSQACDTDDTIYFGDGSYLYYVDKAAGVGGPLCGKPECSHNDMNCNAFFSGGIDCLSYYVGRLYAVCHTSVISIALDGTDRLLIRELDRDLVPNSRSQSFWYFHRGYIYLSCQKRDVKNGEQIYSNYVCAFSLVPEEENIVILDTETNFSYYSTIQSYEEDLYIMTCGDPREDLTIEDEYWHYDFTIRHWNMETRELEIVYEESNGPLSAVWEMWVMDNGVLYGGPSNEDFVVEIYDYSKDTGSAEMLFRFEDTPICVGNVQISDNLIVGCKALDEGLYVLVKDFDGKTLIEETYRLNWTVNSPRLFGTDENHLYFFDHNGGGNTVITVPLDGSETRVLWSREI